MPPKKKKIEEGFPCDQVKTERFYAPHEDLFKLNWWEVFCFPYVLCSRIWDFCFSLCTGTNQCVIYWMFIQWIICKITRITTPDPILFPYYFYMFCQVILLSAFFIILWLHLGNSVIIPFFKTFYEVFTYDEEEGTKTSAKKTALRRYCFRKGEIFEPSFRASRQGTGDAWALEVNPVVTIAAVIVDTFVCELLSR